MLDQVEGVQHRLMAPASTPAAHGVRRPSSRATTTPSIVKRRGLDAGRQRSPGSGCFNAGANQEAKPVPPL
jgi:hypothetical protein